MPEPAIEPSFDDLRAAYEAGYARAWWECTDDGVKRPMPPDIDDWLAGLEDTTPSVRYSNQR